MDTRFRGYEGKRRVWGEVGGADRGRGRHVMAPPMSCPFPHVILRGSEESRNAPWCGANLLAGCRLRGILRLRANALRSE